MLVTNVSGNYRILHQLKQGSKREGGRDRFDEYSVYFKIAVEEGYMEFSALAICFFPCTSHNSQSNNSQSGPSGSWMRSLRAWGVRDQVRCELWTS